MIPAERIEQIILLIRGEKVILDYDLARLYGVTTKRLNEQVKRNQNRFPDDFLFQLTPDEKTQVVAICDHLSSLRFSPNLPLAFTEHGAIMAASVLNTPLAVEMSVFVVRAFVRLRQVLASHKALAAKMTELEKRIGSHDRQILAIIDSIRKLMNPRISKRKRRIGFLSEE